MAAVVDKKTELLMRNKLKTQTILNEKRFMQLFQDIKTDVVRLTENSKSLQEWLVKLQGYGNANIFMGGPKTAEALKLVELVSVSGTHYSMLPPGSTQELVKGVISENTMHYVTRMGEDLKTELRKIAVESYDQNIAPRDIANEMARKIDGMSQSRARVIARTETMRASNLSNYAVAKERGATGFRVRCDPKRCDICAELYDDGNEVFPIDRNDLIPPAHPNCRCVPDFIYDWRATFK